MRRALPAALLMLSSELHAFQPCPGESQPCASPGQVLLLVVLPCLVLAGLALLAKKTLQRRWLRLSGWLLLGCVGLLWLLAIYAAFNAFLAPCASGCWYGIVD